MKLHKTEEAYARPQLEALVINWHVTEVCNYSCRYCYAKWTSSGKELIHNFDNTRAMLVDVFQYFSPLNKKNPLRQYMDWKTLRLNLAGGEPLLYQEEVVRIMQSAKEIGFDTSLITNGSRLSNSLATDLAPCLSMLGLSLDSVDASTNRGIGRIDRHAGLLDIEGLPEVLAAARKINPTLRLKVNTVVNALNCDEDMSGLIHRLNPERWKVLRMLPIVTNDLAVSNVEFDDFVNRHNALGNVMCVEDNDEMGESYLMIDPHGRFFQNAVGQSGYRYSRTIREVGSEEAFSEISLSPAKFCARYAGVSVQEAA
jgi:radical S-adenosyl methionine domain-containing protein 2